MGKTLFLTFILPQTPLLCRTRHISPLIHSGSQLSRGASLPERFFFSPVDWLNCSHIWLNEDKWLRGARWLLLRRGCRTVKYTLSVDYILQVAVSLLLFILWRGGCWSTGHSLTTGMTLMSLHHRISWSLTSVMSKGLWQQTSSVRWNKQRIPYTIILPCVGD